MITHSSQSRSMLADQIVNSLKAKSSKYHLTATKKIKKPIKKPIIRKQSQSIDNIPLLTPQNSENQWYRDETGRIKYVIFTIQENVQEKKGCFSEMVKQITERFRVKNEAKTVFSQCYLEKDSDNVYFANSINDEGKFLIGKSKPFHLSTFPTDNSIQDHDFASIVESCKLDILYN